MKKNLNISIIIPTKDRNEFLKKTIKNLLKYSFFFYEIIIVDSSSKKIQKLNKEVINKTKTKIKYFISKPSISIQRNIGLKKISKKSNYVMFLDDDIIFFKYAFRNMLSFIRKNSHYAGIGFNLIIKQKQNFLLEKIKKNKIFTLLNIYNNKDGYVTKSGWHTKAINLKKDTEVKWLPTQAVIYNLENLKNSKFALQFGKYSYLEDLDFSYNIAKKHKLIICHSAKYYSDNDINRDSYFFGIKEIANRYYFVKKHYLSIVYFFIGCLLLTIKNLFSSLIYFKPKLFLRSAGNISSVLQIFILNKKNFLLKI